MRSVAIVLAVVGWCSWASAADLPQFNVALHCASFSAGSGVGACQRAEVAARDAVVAAWDSYPLQRKHFCIQSERFRAKIDRSYSNLAKCLADPSTTS